MSDAFEERVVAIIAARRKVPQETIKPETTLTELGVDSLDAIELVFQFEDEFNITITDEAVKQLRTVGDVLAALHAALPGSAAPSH